MIYIQLNHLDDRAPSEEIIETGLMTIGYQTVETSYDGCGDRQSELKNRTKIGIDLV